MRVVAFRHVPFQDLGLIRHSLDERGIEVEYADLYRAGSRVPDIRSAAGLIFMGGPTSVNDDYGWLRHEERIVREAARSSLPVLGICLGAQLIARALGGRVYPNPVNEIGWRRIEFTREAATDPLFGGLPEAETVFEWHGETFDLPPDSVLLAHSRECARQAFHAGEGVYGLQFHLEVTPAMIANWLQQDALCGDLREVETPIDPDFNAMRLRELASLVFGRWCDLVRSPGSFPKRIEHSNQ